jgi:hypothetical protein
MAAPTRGSALNSIGNKMLAVLVAVAVLPAVAVSLYALRKTSDALSEQALTLISEACITDARRIEDQLSAVERSVGELAERPELRFLFDSLAPRSESGEVQVPGNDRWERVRSDLDAVDQRLRSLFEQQRSCRTALVRSLLFHEEHDRPVLRLDRRGDQIDPTDLVERGADDLPREKPTPPDPTIDLVLNEWSSAKEEHPERDVLRATVTGVGDDCDDALELFAARVQDAQGKGLGWVFLVHSYRELLRDVRAWSFRPNSAGSSAKRLSCDVAIGLSPSAR